MHGVFIGLGIPLENAAYIIQLPSRLIYTSDVTFVYNLTSGIEEPFPAIGFGVGQADDTRVREQEKVPYSVLPSFSFQPAAVLWCVHSGISCECRY